MQAWCHAPTSWGGDNQPRQAPGRAYLPHFDEVTQLLVLVGWLASRPERSRTLVAAITLALWGHPGVSMRVRVRVRSPEPTTPVHSDWQELPTYPQVTPHAPRTRWLNLITQDLKSRYQTPEAAPDLVQGWTNIQKCQMFKMKVLVTTVNLFNKCNKKTKTGLRLNN